MAPVARELLARSYRGRAFLLGWVGAALGACSSPTDPFAGGGYATVEGMVTESSGAPLAGITVLIACAGSSSPVATSTDSTGRYVTNVYVSGIRPGDRVRCRFSEPNTLTPQARVDTVLGLTRPPAMAALQTVDLHETP